MYSDMSEQDRVPEYVVRVTGRDPESRDAIFLGSAVFLSTSLLLTCRHVCFAKNAASPFKHLRVLFEGEPLPATVLHHDQTKDLAVLKLDEPAQNVLVPSWGYPHIAENEKVRIIGFPENNPYNRDRSVTDADNRRILLKADVALGISGGIGQITNQHLHPDWCCVGLARRTLQMTATELIAAPVIKEFLGRWDIPLPEHPPAPKSRRPASPPDVTRYLDYARTETGYISLMSLGVTGRGVGLPEDVAIETLWVPAHTRALHETGRDSVATELSTMVNRHSVLVVEGDAGSGKSTFLKRLAHAMLKAPGTDPLALRYTGHPLWLPVKKLEACLAERYPKNPPREPGLTWISDYFATRSRVSRWNLDAEFFSDALHDPKNLLLVDGLDEAAPPWRPVLAALLREAARTFTCGIVITLRPEAEHAGPLLAGISARFPIREMEDPEIDRFLTQWTGMVKSYDETAAEAHAEALRENLRRPEIRRMARNPLMLTLLAMATRGRAGYRLPEQRAELYELIVKRLAESQSRPDDEFSAPTFLENLSVLALRMTERGEDRKYQIGFDDAAVVLTEYLRAETLEPARHFLHVAEEKTRLITVRGRELQFWHRSFQEFLTARQLANQEDLYVQAVALLKSRESPEVLRLLAGFLQQAGGRSRLDGLFKCLFRAADPSLESAAYLTGVVGSMLADLSPTPYRLPPDVQPVWQERRDLVMRIFSRDANDLRETATIPLKTRIAAAEALGQAGDPRLRLPRPDLGDPRWLEYWVRVEGGKFRMGKEFSTVPVEVDGFWLGKYPVTVQEYEIYLQSQHLTAAKEMGFEEQLAHPSQPLVRVTWYEAEAYCKWAGDSLPTEAQWEYAARGTQSWIYPWGSEPSPEEEANLANCAMRVGQPTPVGLFPAGAQRETGILDLAGNVLEWTSSDYDFLSKVARGGSFGVSARGLRAASRLNGRPGERYGSIGFRCLRDVIP